jgi:hypothetical protein
MKTIDLVAFFPDKGCVTAVSDLTVIQITVKDESASIPPEQIKRSPQSGPNVSISSVLILQIGDINESCLGLVSACESAILHPQMRVNPQWQCHQYILRADSGIECNEQHK